MSAHDKIERIEALTEGGRVDEVNDKKSLVNQPIEGKFQALLEETQAKVDPNALDGAKGGRPTLDDVAAEAAKMQPSVASQAKDVIALSKEASQKIDAIKADLRTENLEIKKPVAKLMNHKLTHVEDSLRIALSKAGANEGDIAEAPKTGNMPNPAAKFLDHLTHAQDQLNNLGDYLDAMVNAEKELSPANMLSIQLKVNHIQQELEFFTNLLNKSLESTKALMNVQV